MLNAWGGQRVPAVCAGFAGDDGDPRLPLNENARARLRTRPRGIYCITGRYCLDVCGVVGDGAGTGAVGDGAGCLVFRTRLPRALRMSATCGARSAVAGILARRWARE